MIEPNKCKDMNDIRTAIDEIDADIVKLISKRSEYVHEASKFKKDETAVKDSNRVAKVIESKKELATKHGASPELIGDIYKMMIDFFIKEELEEWNKQQNV